jgi:hypothetical protein
MVAERFLRAQKAFITEMADTEPDCCVRPIRRDLGEHRDLVIFEREPRPLIPTSIAKRREEEGQVSAAKGPD